MVPRGTVCILPGKTKENVRNWHVSTLHAQKVVWCCTHPSIYAYFTVRHRWTLYKLRFCFQVSLIVDSLNLSGKRPFGVSLLYMGWDKHYGFQLYQSDPSGNYGGWKATCIGNNSSVSECSLSLRTLEYHGGLILISVKSSMWSRNTKTHTGIVLPWLHNSVYLWLSIDNRQQCQCWSRSTKKERVLFSQPWICP